MIQNAIRKILRDYNPIVTMVGTRVYWATFDQATVTPALAFNLTDMQGMGTFGECRTRKGLLEIGIQAQLNSDVQTLASHIRQRLEKQEYTAEGYTIKFFTVVDGPSEFDNDKKGLYMPLQVKILATQNN